MKENSEIYQNPTVFDKLLEPVSLLTEEQARKLTPHHNEKFSFREFFRLLIFYFVSGGSSMKLLINTCLKKNLLSPELNLARVPYSTFSDAFGRFPPDLFKAVFAGLISSVSLQSVPELSALGLLYCADGSLFPVLKSMHWAVYKKNRNAARLHLCFELNRMIAADILVGSGNSAERDALRKMLVTGATYIADRGYAAFRMFHDIVQAQAHFIIRVKSNLLYTSVESFTVRIPASVKLLFSQTTDEAVQYDNDPHSHVWRLIRFEAGGDTFYILTDRHDLTTFQIITLYAYRWQAELFFRFLKRTMSGIHLTKHNEDGVTIQFYAMLITALLQLKLKQDTVIIQNEQDVRRSGVKNPDPETKGTDVPNSDNKIGLPDATGIPNADRPSGSFPRSGDKCDMPPCEVLSHPYQFFEMIGEKTDKYWKIGIHWLTTLRQILQRPFDDRAIEILGGG
jgi:hypothetical protein